MAQVCSASEDRQAKAAKAIRQRKQRSEKRTDELSRLIRKLYEDNVNGRLSDKLFEQMLHDFEAELEGLTDSITQDQQELDRISRETVNAEKFLALVKKYTDFSELTPAMINEFVEKILVHQAEGKGASRTQKVEIFFNFIGKVEIPRKEIELTEEEKAARQEAMQNGLKAAVAVPLSVAKRAYEIMPYAEVMVTKGNKTAVTDALVATMMARTAVLGALFNVKINLESIKDEAFVAETTKEVEVLEKKAIEHEQKILAKAGVSKSVVE